MLIAHLPPNASKEPFPFPASEAGRRLALFEHGKLEREVDILWFRVRRQLNCGWPLRRRYPLFLMGFLIPVAFTATAVPTILARGCPAIVKFAR